MDDVALLREHEKTVKTIARHVHRLCPWAGIDDSIQWGYIGLLKAWKRRDPARPFLPYARVAIRNTMMSSPEVRRGVDRSNVATLNAARREWFQLGNERPSIEQLASKTGFSERKILLLLEIEACSRSQGGDEPDTTIDLQSAARRFDLPPEWNEAAQSMFDRLVVDCELSAHQLAVVSCEFGSGAQERESRDEELAAKLRITEVNVRALRSRAYKAIKCEVGQQLERAHCLDALEPSWAVLNWGRAGKPEKLPNPAQRKPDEIEAILEDAHAKLRLRVGAGTSPDWLADLVGLALNVVHKETAHG